MTAFEGIRSYRSGIKALATRGRPKSGRENHVHTQAGLGGDRYDRRSLWVFSLRARQEVGPRSDLVQSVQAPWPGRAAAMADDRKHRAGSRGERRQRRGIHGFIERPQGSAAAAKAD